MTKLPAPLAELGTEHAGLGLQQGEVIVVDHNPGWAPLAASLVSHVHQALRDHDVAVEHVGSTSVPGLAAKPMLDIAVGTRTPLAAETAVAKLEAAGFDYQLDLGEYGGLFFTLSSEPSLVVAHLHVVSTNEFQWRWYLAFRDGLRADPALRKEYESLKRAAAADHALNRDGYTNAKFEWVLATVTSLDGADAPTR